MSLRSAMSRSVIKKYNLETKRKMFLIFVVVIVAVVLFLICSFIVLFWRSADADLLLLFKEKFGRGPESLKGQVAWITGASSGIGEYIAYELARAGCRLILSARRRDELERVRSACLREAAGQLTADDILVQVLDVQDFESHKSLVIKVLEHFTKIDILINNAGCSQRAKWMDIELDVDRTLFEINVLGPVSLSQVVLPHMMKRNRGTIVIVSSMVGKLGLPHSRSYNGTKSAVQAYFECLRTEVADNNISITIACPGPTFSNLFLHAATSKHNEKLGRAMSRTEKRMTTDLCAHYIVTALANKLYEVWIAQQPWLAILYIQQYIPDLGRCSCLITQSSKKLPDLLRCNF
ncbi:dehydrogenase/reductase SDR family member 7-like isoform X3 [Biomphalaria glabrata]|uniref:Dehydrogenase/reductase SDR family member 7-like isoform X3 n=1 Tax=Biomphalaria glabrata TaxID=6526 RepID=A0A9W2ZZS6_BIOGL|nr:dehydrogenase/reductase SDR family member 7-like isoform X3 [Biomphalaria glabrata]